MNCELGMCCKEFTPTKAWQKFCSKRCREIWWGQKNSHRRAEPGTFDERPCEICNKKFTPKLRTQKYDKPGCRWIAQGNRRREATQRKTIRLNRMGRPGARPSMQKLDRTVY